MCVCMCVMPLYPFIWLSSLLTIEARICHCSCDLQKKVLWCHIRTVAASPCTHSAERNRALSWLLFYLNFVQNVCVCVYIRILGSGNNPPRTPHPPPTKIVVVAFKCQAGLDTYSIITPETQLYTSHRKQGPPLSFLKSDTESSQESTLDSPEGMGSQCSAAPTDTFPPRAPPHNSFSWQTIQGGTDPAEPNFSYLAGDHTDGPAWASWTHRQLGVMMHRMLSINRAYCRAEASQAEAPDRDAGGGPAKRGSGRIKRRDKCVKSWCWKLRKDR